MHRVVFFDGPCPFCNWIVHWLMEVDKKKIFYFASLEGETARTLPKDKDSLILLEEEQGIRKLFFEAKAALRIFWLIGGWYRLIGWTYFLPSFLINPLYRFIARHRYRFCRTTAVSLDESRLLP